MTTTSIGTIPDPTPLNVIQGQTFTFSVTLTQSDGTTPRSLAGYYAHMQIRAKQTTTGTLLADLASSGDTTDVGDGAITAIAIEPGGATGVVSVAIPASVMNGLVKTLYYYDLFIIGPSDSQRLLYGPVNVSPSVTASDG